jgi:hypothetical protein
LPVLLPVMIPLELLMRVKTTPHRNRNRSFLVGLQHQGQSRYQWVWHNNR